MRLIYFYSNLQQKVNSSCLSLFQHYPQKCQLFPETLFQPVFTSACSSSQPLSKFLAILLSSPFSFILSSLRETKCILSMKANFSSCLFPSLSLCYCLDSVAQNSKKWYGKFRFLLGTRSCEWSHFIHYYFLFSKNSQFLTVGSSMGQMTWFLLHISWKRGERKPRRRENFKILSVVFMLIILWLYF